MLWRGIMLAVLLFFSLIFFIKAYVVDTNLNCIDKLVQFKWVPTTLCLYKSICYGYQFELHWQVNAIQMGTHNICLYKEVDKKFFGCSLNTAELLESALIEVCAVIRSNTVTEITNSLYFALEIWRLDTLAVFFLPFLPRMTTFVTSCLFYCLPSLFLRQFTPQLLPWILHLASADIFKHGEQEVITRCQIKQIGRISWFYFICILLYSIH